MKNAKKDEYLENLYLVLEMCNLTISNRHVFDPKLVEKAKRVKKETEDKISLRNLLNEKKS